jgi:hypothetical protein
MKRAGIVLTVLILVMVAYYINAEAAATDKTVSIVASGTVSASTSMSIAPASITFGTTSADAYPTVPANNKVVISYTSNYNPWKIMVYTNNTQVNDYNLDTKKGSYAKGGLVSGTGDTASVVPCKWISKVGTSTVIPALPTPASLHNYIKDKRDMDDPATSSIDESWAAGFATGYQNVAFGDTRGGYCVDPTNSAVGPNQYKGDAVTPASGIAVYIDAMFGTTGQTPAIPAGAGIYSTTIYFDLYHE